MRAILGVVAFLLIAAAPQAAKDWRLTAGIAPGGGFVVGNPAAKVKLIEYLSFTCDHCGHFVAESRAGLHDGFVRRGSVQVETRAAARDGLDMAAWTVARCGGPKRFHALSAAIFAAQADWIRRGDSYARANRGALQAMSQMAQLRAIATQSGLAAIAARTGVTPAALNQCFASDVQVKPILAMTEAAFARIAGTPAFDVDGSLVDGADWRTLEPKLRAAGAR